MSLAKAVSGLFKSVKRKQLEADRDLVATFLGKFAEQNLADLRYAEDHFSPAQMRRTAVAAYLAALQYDRSEQGSAKLRALVRRMRMRGGSDNSRMEIETAYGWMLGYRMIAAGAMLLKLDKGYRDELVPQFELVEMALRRFIERQGKNSWPVSYVDNIGFERYRVEFREQELASAPLENPRSIFDQATIPAELEVVPQSPPVR